MGVGGTSEMSRASWRLGVEERHRILAIGGQYLCVCLFLRAEDILRGEACCGGT
jgi:hypothetical protein